MSPTPSPIPTPYDITSLPLIPWEPGIKSLIVVIVICCLVWISLRSRLQRNYRFESITDPKVLLTKIKERVLRYNAVDPKLAAAQLSLGLKRILSLSEQDDFSTLTSRDLINIASKRSSFKSLAQALTDLECIIYGADSEAQNSRLIIEETINHLQAFLANKEEQKK